MSLLLLLPLVVVDEEVDWVLVVFVSDIVVARAEDAEEEEEVEVVVGEDVLGLLIF